MKIMNTNNDVDLKMVKNLLDYVIFECAHLKILPSGQFYPEKHPHFFNKPPLALILRIVTNEICIVLIEKKKEISIPLEQLCRFAINEKRDIELEMKENFRKFFYEYPLGGIDSRIQIAIDPLRGFFDEIKTIVFSPYDYIEDERYRKLINEMRRLRFNKPKEISKKRIPQLDQLQEKSIKLRHNEPLDNDQITRRYSRCFNEHKQSFNQELQHTCKRRNQEQSNITDDRGNLFEKDYNLSKFVVTTQNVVKESNVTKGEFVIESVQSCNESIAEWINKTDTENIMDLPMTPSTIKPREEVITQLEKQEIMNLGYNKFESEDISVPKPIDQNEAFVDKRHGSEDEISNISFITEPQLYITFAFLIQSYAMVIPYETSLKDLINTIEQRYNIKVNPSNFYFKNAVNDRISIMDEGDWFVARFEAKEVMNNKIVLYFSQS
ncbi:hypothetical protein C1645_807646 [Glomus cerebriforme]|uniref:PB1 domain-containing protein n=1 Tax=Glomus cerebriforme TaxID=658196 RepID=A0A397SP60_9GLOM|nr:hypothetical protein C1645_807646 [Glomus cerebriforme]